MVAMMHETVGREALIALSNHYESVADALMEIIDNPFDYRRGRSLRIDINVSKKRAGRMEVLDVGGEGMDDAGLADWITWGTGHEYAATDIGQYHVGGKLAAIYLADSIEIVCRRSGDDQAWRFSDLRWGTRTNLLRDAAPERLGQDDLPSLLQDIPPRVGFTMIRMEKLKEHRWEETILNARLANTYRTLIKSGHCRITVNGSDVSPINLPTSTTYKPIDILPIAVKPGVRMRGRIWVMERGGFEGGRGLRLKAGIRALFNGRLITDGEEFGHYLAGKGAFQRLMGEVEIVGLKPNPTKDGWDKASPAWCAISDEMHRQMQPLVDELNQATGERDVSRDQRKRANRVRREIEEVLKHLACLRDGALQLSIEGTSPDGRRPDTAPGRHIAGTGATPTDPVPKTPRTPAPADAVGSLLRRRRAGLPSIEFDSLGGVDRSQMKADGQCLVINRDYPLYPEIGETDSYIAETYVLGILEPEIGEGLASSFVAEVNRVLAEWHQIRDNKA